ncbi:TPA: hypothetical protein KD020_003719 [Vibrio parahaemolyticus]|nr:hypothetical protein [Vibrio parahaemolyticus]
MIIPHAVSFIVRMIELRVFWNGVRSMFFSADKITSVPNTMKTNSASMWVMPVNRV